MKEKENNRIGVLLLNLGGPDSLEAVRPFLYNLFSDREIIRLGPSFLQKPLAWLISALRHGKTEGYYRLIGGKSPILEITKAQAGTLEAELNSTRSSISDSCQFKVYIGMRYWRPFIEDVVPEIQRDGVEKLVVLGLYPHYSLATTGSSLSKFREVSSRFPIETFTISSWYDHPLYVEALVEKIRKGLEYFQSSPFTPHSSLDDVCVLFSAHSLPVKFIEEGDPYVDQIRGTIAAVTKKISIEWDLSYQSKSGPVKWLEPSTDEKIGELAGSGIKNILVVPISFVSDHIETLYEIDILYMGMAERLGMRLKRTESLNTSPLFIAAMKDIVTQALQEAGWM